MIEIWLSVINIFYCECHCDNLQPLGIIHYLFIFKVLIMLFDLGCDM